MSSMLTMKRILRLTILMMVLGTPAWAAPIAALEFLETNLGGGRFQYDYTLFNLGDPVTDAGYDIFDVTFESAANTFSNLVSPAGWDGFGGLDFAVFFAPFGAALEVAPGASLAGFRFETDARIGPMQFLASFTNPADPFNPVSFQGVSTAAVSSTVPEPSALLLLATGIGAMIVRRRRV